MGTVSNKNVPPSHRIQKLVGRTYHLPLPNEETLKRIPAPQQPLLPDQELYILVRGLPSKQKKIWQSLVNVHKVYEALRWLKCNNPLYAEIILPERAEELLDCLSDSEAQFPDESEAETTEGEDAQLLAEEELTTTEDERAQSLFEEEPAITKRRAMLTQRDTGDEFYENYTIQHLEGKRINKVASELYQMLEIDEPPLDSRTETLDLMCFPDLFPHGVNGQHEKRMTHIQLCEFVKAMMTSRHPQFRLSIPYIFYLLNQINMKQIAAGIYHVLNVSKEKMNAAQYRAKLAEGVLEGNIMTIFSRFRNSEQFWKKPRCQLSLMIDIYGPPTFFVTLSPADYDDSELEEYLKTVGGVETQGKTLSAMIAADPVSVSRFYDQKFKAMLAFICHSTGGPLGLVEHHAWRREYQGRGVQHFHCLFWIRDAPVIGVSSSEEIAIFIQKYITCFIPDKATFPTLYEKVIKYQTHRNNTYCLRPKKFKGGIIRQVCRFGFPRPVTKVLKLRDVATSISGRQNLQANSRLYDLPRKEVEQFINDYNIAILSRWTGNCDVQFVGESSSVLGRYLSKYQTKPEKSHVTDLSDANSTKSLQSRLWNIALRSLSSRECGTLEAADTLLGHSLFGTDRDTTFKWIDVGMRRNRKLKSKREVDKLDDEDEDLFCPSLIDSHYPNRPEELDHLSLYDFAKDYDIVKTEPKRNKTVYLPFPEFGFLRQRTTPRLINHFKYDPVKQPEQYCYSLLLLFKPWRDIDELLDNHPNFSEAFHASKDSMEELLKYHEKHVEIERARAAMLKVIEEKTLAGQENTPDIRDSEECNNAELRAGQAIDAMQDLRAGNQDEDEDLPFLISQLNGDQRRVFEYVICCIQSGIPMRHFVSGVGGTGKSFLIKVIKLWVKLELRKGVAITAPTGIAAFNIGGLTIHRLLQLPIEHGTAPKYTPLSDTVLQVIRLEMKNVILLIIDEISMVSNVTLHFIHSRLAEIYDTASEADGWFGKIHILVLGDLLQLPPVNSNSPFCSLTQAECDKYFSSLGRINLWSELFTYDELQINMRQRNDSNFVDLLAQIRLGFCSQQNLQVLQKLLIPLKSNTLNERLQELAKYVIDHGDDAVCLLPTRRMCDALNESVLALLPGEKIIIESDDSLSGRKSDHKRAMKKLHDYENDCSRTAGLELKLVLKIGAKVMLKQNIDVSKGYVNGAIGTVVSISSGLDKFPEKIQILMRNNTTLDLTPVTGKFEILQGIFVYRKQFPLMLAYGITIHKSQGLSLENCIVDIGNSIFSCGQSYVALSRATSLQGLRIINIDPKNIQAQKEAILEYNRLRHKYLPHLASIKIMKHSLESIPDQAWAPRDSFRFNECPQSSRLQITNPQIDLANEFPAFVNTDQKSCYANAILQSFLSLKPLLIELKNAQQDTPLHVLACEYYQKMTPLSAWNVRVYLGVPFTRKEQQDAPEFAHALINSCELLQNFTKFKEIRTRHCENCGLRNEEELDNYILRLAVSPNAKSIKDLCANLSFESPIPDFTCGCCGAKSSVGRMSVNNPSDLLIVQLELWHVVRDQVKKNSKVRFNALPSTELHIANSRYQLHAALFHHGESVQMGHYTTVVKVHKNQFVLANDLQISTCRWPRASKDAYLLFYKKLQSSKKYLILTSSLLIQQI